MSRVHPAFGQKWQCIKNSKEYRIIATTNEMAENKEKRPIRVVYVEDQYVNPNVKLEHQPPIWDCLLSDWHLKFIFIKD